MKNRHLHILSAVLAAIGTGIFIYKAFVLNLSLRPDARVVNWEVQT